MFASIRRHQKWLWFLIIVVVILSFVVFFSPTARYDRGGTGREADLGTLDGQPIARDKFLNAYRESLLSYLFRYGEWPSKDAMSRQMDYDGDTEARNRLLLVSRMQQLGISVTDEGAAKWIANSPVFSDREKGGFKSDTYNLFVKNKLPEANLTEIDFHRFARHEAAIQHLAAVVGGAGKLISTPEAETLYRQENEVASVSLVTFANSNYLASVKVAPDEISRFFTNRMSMYRIPERVQVSYVRFMATNYNAEADKIMASDTNLAAKLDQVYLQRGVNFFVEPDGKTMSANAAKDKIKSELKNEYALRAARRAAAAFADELFGMKPVIGDNLEKLASTKNLLTGVTAPFDRYNGPSEFRVLDNFNTTAFNLNAEEPYSVPLPDQDSVFVIALKARVPSEVPPLDTIRERVTNDYRQTQSREGARKAAEAFHTSATNLLAQGKSFQDAANEAKLTVVTPSGIAKSARMLADLDPRIDLQSLKSAAFRLQKGGVSSFVPTSEGGFVVYLRSIAPADEATMKTELPKFIQTLQQRRQMQAFNDWFMKEREIAKIESPRAKKSAN